MIIFPHTIAGLLPCHANCRSLLQMSKSSILPVLRKDVRMPPAVTDITLLSTVVRSNFQEPLVLGISHLLVCPWYCSKQSNHSILSYICY